MPYFPGAGFLAPGPTYIAPSSSFFLSSGGAPASLIDFLPSKIVADRLLIQYWEAVHPVARAVHRSSFQKRYDAFWDDVTSGIEPPNSLQAIVFAAMFSGVVSMPEETIIMQFGVGKKGLVENFQVGTETALGKANFIRTAKVETLQAFVMYMVGYSSISRPTLHFEVSTCSMKSPTVFVIHHSSLPIGSIHMSILLFDPPHRHSILNVADAG